MSVCGRFVEDKTLNILFPVALQCSKKDQIFSTALQELCVYME